ncbi:MAG: ketoacyl-ACP synthase III [Clostridiales bacterium]|nr:ketoacyl-ACP synthase III [Clostridiales bacterium]
MITKFRGKRITSMLGILPETVGLFDDEVSNYSFPPKQTMRLKKIMGYDRHRLAKDTSTVSDFAVYGLRYMLENNWIKKEEIGAVITVTLCPDHFVPHISNIVHDKCGLDTDVLCFDIAQGCCGFLVGLMQSFMLLEHTDKKIVLINGDVLSHKVSKQDRNDYPLIGDGATITVLENGGDDEIYYEMHTDGSRGKALIIPAGAFRMPSNQETGIMVDQGDGNLRSLDNIAMDGSEVFNFVQVEVPPMLENAFKRESLTVNDFDWFLFHQPNRFMLQKLAEKAGLPQDKLPMNLVENFGNPSGASIPMTAILNCKESLINKDNKCCLSAFGSGLAWGVMIMNIGKLDHCDLIESDL